MGVPAPLPMLAELASATQNPILSHLCERVHNFWASCAPPSHVPDLSLKTQHLFSTMLSLWDADFYFKVDDDVALSLEAMSDYLAARRAKGNLYMVRTGGWRGSRLARMGGQRGGQTGEEGRLARAAGDV